MSVPAGTQLSWKKKWGCNCVLWNTLLSLVTFSEHLAGWNSGYSDPAVPWCSLLVFRCNTVLVSWSHVQNSPHYANPTSGRIFTLLALLLLKAGVGHDVEFHEFSYSICSINSICVYLVFTCKSQKIKMPECYSWPFHRRAFSFTKESDPLALRWPYVASTRLRFCLSQKESEAHRRACKEP